MAEYFCIILIKWFSKIFMYIKSRKRQLLMINLLVSFHMAYRYLCVSNRSLKCRQQAFQGNIDSEIVVRSFGDSYLSTILFPSPFWHQLNHMIDYFMLIILQWQFMVLFLAINICVISSHIYIVIKKTLFVMSLIVMLEQTCLRPHSYID